MSERDPIATGASAARVFAEACDLELQTRGSLQKLEVVRSLARELEDRLESLSRAAARKESPDLLAEAAQRCGDLATLASCNAGELGSPEKTSEAVNLAFEAVESLKESLEDSAENSTEGPSLARKDLISRDLRSGFWKVSLAAGQLEDS